MINYKNRGMLLESIINNSIHYYNSNKIAYFQKKNLDILFKKVENVNKKPVLSSTIISKKSTVDYYGVYNGRYVCFEAKSTKTNSIPIHNIKEHQHNHLKLINSLGGKAFYIFYFKGINKFYFVDIKNWDLNFQSKKTISINEIKLFGKELTLIFPGILDFLNFI